MPIPKTLQSNAPQNASNTPQLTLGQQRKVRLAILQKRQDEHDAAVKEVLGGDEAPETHPEADTPEVDIPDDDSEEPQQDDTQETPDELAASSQPTEHPPPKNKKRKRHK